MLIVETIAQRERDRLVGFGALLLVSRVYPALIALTPMSESWESILFGGCFLSFLFYDLGRKRFKSEIKEAIREFKKVSISESLSV